jgi:hypothetical protein
MTMMMKPAGLTVNAVTVFATYQFGSFSCDTRLNRKRGRKTTGFFRGIYYTNTRHFEFEVACKTPDCFIRQNLLCKESLSSKKMASRYGDYRFFLKETAQCIAYKLRVRVGCVPNSFY